MKHKARGKKASFTVKDGIVTVICVFGAALAFLFFWRDLHATLAKVNETAIGHVHYKYKVAQRRFADRLTWDMLKQDSPVYSGDMLHTAALGEATIILRDGETIDLGQNSMAQVFYSADGSRVELSSGTININTGDQGATLRLVSAGVEVQITSSSVVSANTKTGGAAAIQVASGNAEIITKEGARHAAQAGEALAFSEAGKAEVIPIVTLLKPASNTFLASAGGDIPVGFFWNTQNFDQNSFVRLEVATDRRFTRVVERADTHGIMNRTVLLAPGTYWWRAYPVREGAPESSAPDADDSISYKLLIGVQVKAALLSPQNGAVFHYRVKTPQIRFQWHSGQAGEGAAASNEWLLTVSDNAAFSQPRLTQTVRGQSFMTSALGAGRWFWRVEPAGGAAGDAGGTGGTAAAVSASSTAVFVIEQNASELRPVELSMPAAGAFVNIAPSAAPVNFIWKNENEAASYRVTIARDSGFTDVALSRDLAESRFVYNPREGAFPAGVYFWRVSWVDDEGAQAGASASRPFNALDGDVVFENVTPADNWVASGATLAQTRFTWKSNLGGAGRLQIAADSSFAALLHDAPAEGGGSTATGVQRIEGAAGKMLAAGSYYWRVFSPANTLQTTPRHLEVKNALPVTLRSPPDGAAIDGLAALRNPPLLVWEAGDPPASARLILSANPNPESGAALLDLVNPARSVRAPALPGGRYYWTVKAEAGGNDLSAQAAFSFTIGEVPPLPPARPQTPAEGAVITSADLRAKRSIDFSWAESRGANGYILSIFRAADTAQQRPLFTSELLRSGRFSLTTLNVLDTGAFMWRVEPVFINEAGQIEQRGSAGVRRFSINISVPQSVALPDEETYGM